MYHGVKIAETPQRIGFVFSFSLFLLFRTFSVPCARLSWPFCQLLAHVNISYRIISWRRSAKKYVLRFCFKLFSDKVLSRMAYGKLFYAAGLYRRLRCSLDVCTRSSCILEEASTHKSAKTHAGTVFVSHDLDPPFDTKIWFSGTHL